jgi:hypothetical protein
MCIQGSIYFQRALLSFHFLSSYFSLAYGTLRLGTLLNSGPTPGIDERVCDITAGHCRCDRILPLAGSMSTILILLLSSNPTILYTRKPLSVCTDPDRIVAFGPIEFVTSVIASARLTLVFDFRTSNNEAVSEIEPVKFERGIFGALDPSWGGISLISCCRPSALCKVLVPEIMNTINIVIIIIEFVCLDNFIKA